MQNRGVEVKWGPTSSPAAVVAQACERRARRVVVGDPQSVDDGIEEVVGRYPNLRAAHGPVRQVYSRAYRRALCVCSVAR